MNTRLEELRQQFILSVEEFEGLTKPRKRKSVAAYFYCPYAPCCSQCSGIFTFRESLDHLRRVHEHGIGKIKELVAAGLPEVPMRAWEKGRDDDE